MRLRTLIATIGALALLPVPAASAQSPPSAKACAKTNAGRTAPPVIAYDPKPGSVRVFAMQLKHEVRHVQTHAAFRLKIECMIRQYVVPRLARGRGMVNVVAFNEDVGLMSGATGKRGAAARAIMANPKSACPDQGYPCGILAALEAIRTGYSKEMAAYSERFPDWNSTSGSWIAPTDTLARGWMQTFSDLSRRYGVYMLGSNNQAPFRESRSRADIRAFADPDAKRPRSVYVATESKAYNEVFMWGPRNVRRGGPPMLRNVVARNKKVPVTPIEQFLQISPGPATGAEAIANVRPYRLPGTKARIAFATSLPAFVYGDPPAGVDPCSDVSQYYMRCLNQLGANVVMQDEANPGAWTGPDGDGIEKWQPLSWMTSTWRAAADPTVSFDYNVTPHLVGNLADVVFDGQTAITQRGLGGQSCHYIGNASFVDGEDRPDLMDEAGPKSEFIAIAPWVRADGPRDELRAVGAKLAPSSGDPLENDYVETAVIADLTFPRDAERPSCVQDTPPGPPRQVSLTVGPPAVPRGRTTTFRFTTRSAGEPLRYAYIRFAGRELPVDDRGRVSVRLRLTRPGKYQATLIRPGYRRAEVSVRVAR
jgi:hypothetical protein